MKVHGIPCKRVGAIPTRKDGLYAVIPLEVLHNLEGNSDKAKLLVLLWCYGRMNTGECFTLSGKVLKQYGISPHQKRKILASFEATGLLELKKQPGKATEIKLIVPKTI